MLPRQAFAPDDCREGGADMLSPRAVTFTGRGQPGPGQRLQAAGIADLGCRRHKRNWKWTVGLIERLPQVVDSQAAPAVSQCPVQLTPDNAPLESLFRSELLASSRPIHEPAEHRDRRICRQASDGRQHIVDPAGLDDRDDIGKSCSFLIDIVDRARSLSRDGRVPVLSKRVEDGTDRRSRVPFERADGSQPQLVGQALLQCAFRESLEGFGR